VLGVKPNHLPNTYLGQKGYYEKRKKLQAASSKHQAGGWAHELQAASLKKDTIKK